MTIKDGISAGKIPNVNLKVIFAMLEKMGINVATSARNENFDLDEQLIDPLRNRLNATIKYSKYNEKVKNDIKNTHNNLMNQYDVLINKYMNTLKQMQKDPTKDIDLKSINSDDFEDHFKADISEVVGAINTLTSAKANYEKVVKNININRTDLGIQTDNVLNTFDASVLGDTNGKLFDVGTNIEKVEEEINALNNKKSSFKFRQRRIEKKKMKLQEKLNKLKNKQGKLQTKQSKIVNKGNEKYRKIKQQELEKYYKEMERMSNYQTAMSENINLQREAEQELKDAREERDKLVGGNLKTKLEKMQLDREIKKLNNKKEILSKQQNRIQSLKNKKGFCNLSNQIVRVYVNAYTM